MNSFLEVNVTFVGEKHFFTLFGYRWPIDFSCKVQGQRRKENQYRAQFGKPNSLNSYKYPYFLRCPCLKDTYFPLHLLTSQAVNYQLKELPFGYQML